VDGNVALLFDTMYRGRDDEVRMPAMMVEEVHLAVVEVIQSLKSGVGGIRKWVCPWWLGGR
jgi:hypothetical protein